MDATTSPQRLKPMARSNFFSDHARACRIERAEAAASARFVEARAQSEPSVGQWMEIAGAYAMSDGVRSPCTQTFGLGLFKPPTRKRWTSPNSHEPRLWSLREARFLRITKGP